MALVVLIDRPGFRVASDRPVLRREELELVESATGLLAHAAAESESAIAAARELAVREGYRDGYDDARQEAAEAVAAAAMLRRMAVEQLEPLLTGIVMEAVAAVLRGQGRDRLIAQAVDALADALRNARWATLHVAPASFEAARAALEAMSDETGVEGIARVVVDAELEDDDCVLETDAGTADASLATQLHALREAIASAVQGALDNTVTA